MGMRMRMGMVVVVLGMVMIGQAWGQLTADFYSSSCPNVSAIVGEVVNAAVAAEPRMGASLLRLHFHDCFVQGCDASLLLDDPNGEQVALPNLNSIRGLDVVDNIKAAVESICPGIVSCADILAITAERSVVALKGSSWPVLLGRRDGTTFASNATVIQSLVAPTENLSSIIQKFANVGLDTNDVVVLSGAHTIGRARCVTFQGRLYNFSGTGNHDPTLGTDLLATLQALCPKDGSNPNGITNLDQSTGDVFDNTYFKNLKKEYGVLQFDQELYSTPGATTKKFVGTYADSKKKFSDAFGISMINMGNINPITSSNGQIRLKCGSVNS